MYSFFEGVFSMSFTLSLSIIIRLFSNFIQYSAFCYFFSLEFSSNPFLTNAFYNFYAILVIYSFFCFVMHRYSITAWMYFFTRILLKKIKQKVIKNSEELRWCSFSLESTDQGWKIKRKYTTMIIFYFDLN